MMKSSRIFWRCGQSSADYLVWFTALLWRVIVLPAPVKGAEFEYTAINGAVTVTRYNGSGGVVTIPATFEGLPVTRIGYSAFYSSTNVTGVIIPDTVARISGGAFRQCTSLISVMIPDSVTIIEDTAFSHCYSLTNVTIGNGVTYIGPQAFFYCASLPSVAIPDNVTYVATAAFWRCTNLVSVTIGKGLTGIESGAFYQCYRLRTITVDPLNSRYSSRDGVLFDKGQTELIQYPIGKPEGDHTIPTSVARIGDYAFSLCNTLTNLTILDGVTNIGFMAFYWCKSLATVTLGNKVTTIGEEAFYGCDRLTGVSIPDSVTSINDGAFRFCSGLINVTIGNAVTTIGVNAFQGAYGLTNITIPGSVGYIGDWAFGSCTNLAAAYFQGNAPTVGAGVLYGNTTTVFYLPGTTGWETTFGDRPTALWRLPKPVILNFGAQANGFSFTISWATNIDVLVEASTNLLHSAWFPVETHTLTNGWSHFNDPLWTNYGARFYRVRSL